MSIFRRLVSNLAGGAHSVSSLIEDFTEGFQSFQKHNLELSRYSSNNLQLASTQGGLAEGAPAGRTRISGGYLDDYGVALNEAADPLIKMLRALAHLTKRGAVPEDVLTAFKHCAGQFKDASNDYMGLALRGRREAAEEKMEVVKEEYQLLLREMESKGAEESGFDVRQQLKEIEVERGVLRLRSELAETLERKASEALTRARYVDSVAEKVNGLLASHAEREEGGEA